jgi:outer membrane protein OmpA-like peptidoglycan-associated protein
MKNLKLGITALALSFASTAFAQTTSNPWLIGVGAHAENHVAAGKFGDMFSTAFGGNGGELYKMNNFTITPPLSKLTVARNLNKYFVLDWQTTVGNVDNKKIGMDKEFFLQTGLGVQFKLASLWNEESWFDPYLRVGANYLRHDYEGTGAVNSDGDLIKANHFTAAGGIGANFWLTKNFGINLQGDYVGTPTDKSAVANFWQAGASILFRFGNNDRDKDGIKDKDDRCPDIPGLPEFQGCPDTDGDGIPDIDDACPTVAGPVENNGCPWPDTDGDGVLDKDDACPTVPGPVENKGCPWPDTDGDGVLDKDDACPNVAGLKELNGCPRTAVEVAKDTEAALKDILFNFNKATLRPESEPKLDVAAKYIKEFNGGQYLVVGHTDKKGSEAYNLKLSRERAASVVKALEARGVSADKLKSRGVGSAQATEPATASDEARLKDRKVVVEEITTLWESLPKHDIPAPAKKAPAKKKK